MQATPISASSDRSDAASPLQQAKDIEALGYGAVWVAVHRRPNSTGSSPSSRRRPRCRWQPASSTSGRRRARPVAESFHRIEQAYPGRFLLGIGVGHPEALTEYRKPYDALTDYLDKLDEYGVPKNRRVVAALGPKVLKLSAQRSAGAHPYLTTPEHTAQARELIGPSAFLAPEHKVVLTTDAEKARAVGRKALDDLPEPGQLRQQLEAARIHRRRRHPARQRPPASTPWSPTARPSDRGRGSTSTSTPAPITCLSRF